MLYQQVKRIKHLNINSIQFSIILSDSIIIWCAHAQRIAHTTCTMKLLAFCGFSRSVCSAQVRNASQRQQFLFECSNSHLASSTLLFFLHHLWNFMDTLHEILSKHSFNSKFRSGKKTRFQMQQITSGWRCSLVSSLQHHDIKAVSGKKPHGESGRIWSPPWFSWRTIHESGISLATYNP